MGNSHGLLKSKILACTTPANATKSEKSYAFKYQLGAVYNFADAPTGPFPIIENGPSLCSPTCWTNYTPISDATSGACVANTQNASCALPVNMTNTVWNPTGSVLQTWNGTSAGAGSWSPSVPATVYDTNV